MSEDSGLLVQFLLALGVVLILILVLTWILKKVNMIGARVGKAGETPRLEVKEAVQIDHRRRLVLVRRDHVEHLVMIGGENDFLVEHHIMPPQQAQAPRPHPPTAQAQAQAQANQMANQKPANQAPAVQQPRPQQAKVSNAQPPSAAQQGLAPAQKSSKLAQPVSAPGQQTKAPPVSPAPPVASTPQSVVQPAPQQRPSDPSAPSSASPTRPKAPLGAAAGSLAGSLAVSTSGIPSSTGTDAPSQRAPQAPKGQTEQPIAPDPLKEPEPLKSDENAEPQQEPLPDPKLDAEEPKEPRKDKQIQAQVQAQQKDEDAEKSDTGKSAYDDEINRLLNELSGDLKK